MTIRPVPGAGPTSARRGPASVDEPATLAHAGHRHQALAARRLRRRARRGARRGVRVPPAGRHRRARRPDPGRDLRGNAAVPARHPAGSDPRHHGHRPLRGGLGPRDRCADVAVPQWRPGSAPRGGHLPEAVPRTGPEDRRDRRRNRALHAAARPQGADEQSHRNRDRGRRRRFVGQAPRTARAAACRRHSQLHRRPGRRRAADGPAPAVPLPRRRDGEPRRPRVREPADRCDDRRGGRRLRGGRAAGQPGPGGARPGPARVADAARAPREAAATAARSMANRRSPGRRASSGSGSLRRTCVPRRTPSAPSPRPISS